MNDLRFALRQLIKRPSFWAPAILTLALGIGANTAIFSVIYGSWLRPLPFPEAERLAWIGESQKGNWLPMAPGNYLDLEAGSERFEGMAAFTSAAFNLSGDAQATRVEGVQVTADYFDVLGLDLKVGRGFALEEDIDGAARVAVLSHGLWRDRFGGDPEIVGRTIRLDAVPHTVVGVTRRDFVMRRNVYLPGDPQVFVPLRFTAEQRENHGGRWIFAFGRLAPDASVASAESELVRLFEGIKTANPQMSRDVTARVREFRSVLVGGNHTSLLMLGGAAGLVLLVACVNVANLLLARSESRSRELAVRAALGAGRGRLVRAFLSEGLVLSVLGGLVGLGVAFWGVDVLVTLYGAALPRASQIAVSPVAVAFAFGLSVATGLLVGLAPALVVDLHRLTDKLRAGGRGAVGSRRRLRGALVICEIAVTAVLVAGAGLLIQSFWRLGQVDPGVNPENALVFQVSLSGTEYGDRAAVTGFYHSLLDGLNALPGVQHVGAVDRDMFSGGFNVSTLKAVGEPEQEAEYVEYRQVTPGFFAATGIPVLAGTTFEPSDGEAGRNVVVISRALARQLFPGGGALGERLDVDWLSDPEIIGIVGDVREFGPTREPPPRFYWPYPAGYASPSMTLVVRTTGRDPASLVPEVRALVARRDADVPVHGVATLEDMVADTLGERQLALSLLAMFAGVALLLAAVGVYGVIAYTVASRTREVGVRLALGAEAGGVLRAVLGQALRLAGVGVTIGLVGAVILGHVLRSLLWEVSPTDAGTLAAVVGTLLATALVASYVPARRAAQTDPMEALRHE